MRTIACLVLFAVTANLVACTTPPGDVNVTGVDPEDVNGDKTPDVKQSIAVYTDDRGDKGLLFFKGSHHPPDMTNPWGIGYGCSEIDRDPTDDWILPCIPLSQFQVDGVVQGYLMMGLREGVYEMTLVDGNSFEPHGGGWTDPAMGIEEKDDMSFFTSHVNGAFMCAPEQQSLTTLYGFRVLRDGDIKGLGESVAPPDLSCQ